MNVTSKRLHRHKLPSGVLGAALSVDQNQLFAGCIDGVYRLDWNSGEHKKLYQHRSYASGVVVVDEKTIVSAGYDGRLHWYDVHADSLSREVDAHSFWSWDLSKSNDGTVVASSSGQYLAGGYRYEPQTSSEPAVRIYDGRQGTLISEFEFGPPVQAVAVSRSGKYVAAGNLMGDVGVWEVGGQRLASWNTPDFTAFGVIKSHCQIGGIFALTFSPDEQDVLVAGMGPMHDPMAGNGKQRWQRFRWQGEQPEKIAAAKDDQMGEGLMETIAFRPQGDLFVMAGRLRGGAFNAGIFSTETGDLVHSLKTDKRITKAFFSDDGQKLYLCGAVTQSQKADQPFGIVDVWALVVE